MRATFNKGLVIVQTNPENTDQDQVTKVSNYMCQYLGYTFLDGGSGSLEYWDILGHSNTIGEAREDYATAKAEIEKS